MGKTTNVNDDAANNGEPCYSFAFYFSHSASGIFTLCMLLTEKKYWYSNYMSYGHSTNLASVNNKESEAGRTLKKLIFGHLFSFYYNGIGLR